MISFGCFKKYAHMGDWLRANLTAERGYISSNSDSNYMEIIFDRWNSNDEYNNQNNRIGFIVAISTVLCIVIVVAITTIIIIKRKKSKLKNEIPPQNNWQIPPRLSSRGGAQRTWDKHQIIIKLALLSGYFCH